MTRPGFDNNRASVAGASSSAYESKSGPGLHRYGDFRQEDLDLSGPVLEELIPVKIAFEWLALHLGAAIYEDALAPVREALRAGEMDHDAVKVEYLRAERTEPLHGVLLETNDPHMRVQIRLFGSLAYRVHFIGLGYGALRYTYTHRLISDEEGIALAAGEQPESDIGRDSIGEGS